MGKQPITSASAPQPSGAYSQAIAAGGFVFLSGQGPFTPDGEVPEGGFGAQARQVFANLAAVAEAAGVPWPTPFGWGSTWTTWRISPR